MIKNRHQPHNIPWRCSSMGGPVGLNEPLRPGQYFRHCISKSVAYYGKRRIWTRNKAGQLESKPIQPNAGFNPKHLVLVQPDDRYSYVGVFRDAAVSIVPTSPLSYLFEICN